MAILEASVSRYSLEADVSDTIATLVDSAENPWGRRLRDALEFAMYAETAYVVAPYAGLGLDDFRPGIADRPDMPDVADRSVCGVLDKLRNEGYVNLRTVLHETSSNSYLSDGRIITAVEVLRPFALVAVQYRFSREANRRVVTDGHAYADRWQFGDRSYIVPAGWYMVAETGDYVTRLDGVIGMDAMSDDTVCWLDSLEGFSASHCAAGCQDCGARWMAWSGSWHFDPDDCVADAWDFDDADDFDDTAGTVACPSCGTGRVAFDIF
jgi:hypothetical protein